jgi:hypothetical protein
VPQGFKGSLVFKEQLVSRDLRAIKEQLAHKVSPDLLERVPQDFGASLVFRVPREVRDLQVWVLQALRD